MPPQVLSEDDESGSENNVIPFKTAADADVEEGEDAAGSEDGEEYIVEAILDHKYVKNVLLFQVKWQGYDNEEDRTWEPEENLATASDILTEYYADIGGRPTASAGGKKRGRKPGAGAKRSFSESNGETPEASSAPGRKKRAGNGEEIIDAPRKKKDKYPPIGSSNWDKEVLGCVTIVEEPNNHKGVGEKFALLKWENGENTKHALRIAHDHAPKAMLAFYEGHLSFKTVTPPPAAEASPASEAT